MKKKQDRLIIFLICLSLLLHTTVLYLLYRFFSHEEGRLFLPEIAAPQVVWVEPQVLPRIVDIPKPEHEKAPEKAKFAGQYHSSVKEETVAPPHPAHPSRPASEKLHPPNPEPNLKPEETISHDLNFKPGDLFHGKSASTLSLPSPPEKKEYNLKLHGSGLTYGSSGARAGEYFPDYKIGGKTYLNVMNLQDAGYFVRMQRVLRLRWNPFPSVRAYLASQHPGTRRIQCAVAISLDETGHIKRLFIIPSHSSPSGAYDLEALQTFRDSSPFSKPPPEYIKDGELNVSGTFTVYW